MTYDKTDEVREALIRLEAQAPVFSKQYEWYLPDLATLTAALNGAAERPLHTGSVVEAQAIDEANRLRAENAALAAQVERLTDALLQIAGNRVMPDGGASVRAWCTRTALAALDAQEVSP